MAMEQAEQTPDPEARQFLQTVEIVGAGPSGCEMAGAVSELMRWALNNAFKQLDPNKTQIVLVDPGDRVLRAMPEMLSSAALKSLEADGIEFCPRVVCRPCGRVKSSSEHPMATSAFKQPPSSGPPACVRQASARSWLKPQVARSTAAVA
jgi:hypothetical protein